MRTFTICTPTYNRASCLDRVYESLEQQTLRDFEWLIVDDGSTDNTREIVEDYIQRKQMPIRYLYKENGGKHTAVNLGVSQAEGEFFVVADSDDSFKPESLEIFLKEWKGIPEADRKLFRGITCRCYNPGTGEKIGEDFPQESLISNELDVKFKMKMQYELWGMIRTEVMKEFPFPEYENVRMRFFPESVIWDNMARRYQTKYIDVALRAYYTDQEDATTNKGANRCQENYWLWLHYLNDVMDYFRYQPLLFIKSYVGLARDGIRTGRNFKEIASMLRGRGRKILFLCVYPLGRILARK